MCALFDDVFDYVMFFVYFCECVVSGGFRVDAVNDVVDVCVCILYLLFCCWDKVWV